MDQKGFNKVEILIVFAIIIVLVVIFLNFVFDIQKSIRDSKRRADIETIARELEVHFNRQINQFCQNAPIDSYCQIQAHWFDKAKVPVDPLNGSIYSNLPKDGEKKFMICAKLEKGEQYCQNSQQ